MQRLIGKSKNEQHLLYFTSTFVGFSWALLHQDLKNKIFQDPSVQGTTRVCSLPHSVDFLSTTIRVGNWLCNFFEVNFSPEQHCFVRFNPIHLFSTNSVKLNT